MIVADTSFLYALADRNDRGHDSAVAWYRSVEDELATTPLVLAELDHLVAARKSRTGLSAVRRDLISGALRDDWWAGAATESVAVAERYLDLELSLTDASLVALAARLETATIATFDERHFRAVRPLTRAPAFVLVPMDADG